MIFSEIYHTEDGNTLNIHIKNKADFRLMTSVNISKERIEQREGFFGINPVDTTPSSLVKLLLAL